jgi:hypothetical protein
MHPSFHHIYQATSIPNSDKEKSNRAPSYSGANLLVQETMS